MDQFCQNLNVLAASGKIDPLIGRTLELERVIQTLCRRRKNNPLYVGEAGVGKTALVEGLARMIREAGRGQVNEGIEIRCPWALREMRNFIVKSNGRSEAASGHHDDGVLSLAIGAYCLDSAIPYQERVRESYIPRVAAKRNQWS